jgi:8-amino-7-oxononanoate synthase
MSAGLASFAAQLRALADDGLHRLLSPRQGLDFTSNDYLALANAPRLKAAVAAAFERGVPIGAGGSRLLRGNHQEHEALEVEAAACFGAERVLFLGSGYSGNVAVLSTLPQQGDLILYDELVHASAREGLALSRRPSIKFPHNDVNAVEHRILRWRAEGGTGVPWIVVESLYSMDGDRAPLADLVAVADRHDAFLVIDEAHATGIHGPGGRGLAATFEGRPNLVVMHTCGKALGVSGALVGVSRVIGDYLVNRARHFIYATAPSPIVASILREALKILADEPDRRRRLNELVAFANCQVARATSVVSSGSQIIPVHVGNNYRAMRIAERMQASGFDLRAIRPPSVPEGTARLRISITLNVNKKEIAAMVDRLAQILPGEAR